MVTLRKGGGERHQNALAWFATADDKSVASCQ